MIKVAYSNADQRGDLVRGTGNLETDEGLESAVVVSLFSDARASAEDGLDAGADRRGWWGEAYLDDPSIAFGSKLWLIHRKGKAVPQLQIQAVKWAEDALKWLITAGVASSVKASTTKLRPDVLLLTIEIQRPRDTAPRWRRAWEVQLGL